MEPEDLIRELDNCFKIFDKIMQKYGIEKIKTIGDAYMAVGDIPESNHSHHFDCVRAGLEIQKFMHNGIGAQIDILIKILEDCFSSIIFILKFGYHGISHSKERYKSL